MKKFQSIVPMASELIRDIKTRAEQMNPGFVALCYYIEGPVFVVKLVTTDEVPDLDPHDTSFPEVDPFCIPESQASLDTKCGCGRYRRDCSHPIGFEDESQARHALSNRDLGITDGFGRRIP